MTQRTIIAIAALLFAVSAISTTGCKKYPEGPGFSLLGKEKRLLRKWSMNKFYVDGIDSTNLKSFIATKAGFARHGFNPMNGAFHLEDYSLLPATGFSLYWSENKDLINISLDNQYWEIDSIAYSKTIFFFESRTARWHIQRLTGKELILETDINGHHYRLELESYE